MLTELIITTINFVNLDTFYMCVRDGHENTSRMFINMHTPLSNPSCHAVNIVFAHCLRILLRYTLG